ncbi:MAG: hypothetical protein IJY24_05745, partial [Clostridia bacterium]|nr:hypothetical protein [Clostridia bacterium]
GLIHFGVTERKKRNRRYVTPISLYIACIGRKSKVENLRFSPFYLSFFLSIAVSSLRRMVFGALLIHKQKGASECPPFIGKICITQFQE